MLYLRRFFNVARGSVPSIALTGILFGGAGGCVERVLHVESDPPGALVYLNGEEVGRTPVTREFLYYGTMDLRLRKDGYRPLEARPRVWAPLWQIPPIDLVAEAFPLTDRHRLSYTLKPQPEGDIDKAALIDRANELGARLESSEVRDIRREQRQQQPSAE